MALALRRPTRSFEPSRLKNEYRGILNQALADGAVVIRGRGDDNLYIVREEIFASFEASSSEARDFAQFVAAARSVVKDQPAPNALSLGRLSWAADLTPESFVEFANDYVDSFFRAINGGDWESHRQLMLEWRETAAIERDPELLARVSETGDRELHRDLPRPVAQ